MKQELQDTSWKVFLASKQNGGIRSSNMMNFISKSNVFQNDSIIQSDKQKSTLSTLDMKLGKVQEEDEESKEKVEFRSEPIKPKQNIQERDMYLIAKPIIQQYTTLNIVKQPAIQPNTHRISADMHKDLQGLIKRSENLVMEKVQQTIVPKQGQINQQKIINDKFLEHIRRIDQSFSPIKQYMSSNVYENQKVKDKKQQQQKLNNTTSNSTLPKNKYDREFDFGLQNKQGRKHQDQLQDVQLPLNINDIIQLKKKKDNNNTFHISLPDDDYLLTEDLVELNNFPQVFKQQAIETSKQVKKIENAFFNENNKPQFTYVPKLDTQVQPKDIDINNLDFSSVLQIASGVIPPKHLKDLTNKQNASQSSIVNQQINPNQAHYISTNQNFEHYMKQSMKHSTKWPIVDDNQSQDNDSSKDIREYDEKCVGTSPQETNDSQFKFYESKEEGVQISSLAIDEEIRNIPRVGVILSDIEKMKQQYQFAADRQDRAKLKQMLNNKLLDLINLLLYDESFKSNTVGEAVQYLLSQQKILKEQNIDGVSKLELLYIFLTEYKNLKNMTEQELQSQYKIMRNENNMNTFMLVPKTLKKKMREGYNVQQNKKQLNSLSFHFRQSPKASPIKQYQYPTQQSKTQSKWYKSTQKKSKSPMSGQVYRTPKNEDSWKKVA